MIKEINFLKIIVFLIGFFLCIFIMTQDSHRVQYMEEVRAMQRDLIKDTWDYMQEMETPDHEHRFSDGKVARGNETKECKKYCGNKTVLLKLIHNGLSK